MNMIWMNNTKQTLWSIFFLEIIEFSDIINIVGIIPIIAPKELLENGKYKEVKHCSVAYGFADVNLVIDYEEYVEANMDDKKI